MTGIPRGLPPFAALLCALVLVATPGSAAQAQDRAAPAEAGAELRVYLMTMGPGDLVWERFGHNAIWVHDARRGTDIAYNYGMFSFSQPGFLRRFVQGHMMYWMAPEDAHQTVRLYAAYNRSVWLQELDLTPAERVELRDFLEWNAQPENAYYAYDYYRDNCSTRVRDAIDLVIGGRIRSTMAELPTGTTFRSHTRRLTYEDRPIYTGLMLAMGQPIDRPISAWEEMFLPMRLRDRIREVAVVGPDGERRPLVRSELTLFEADRAAVPDEPPNLLAWYLVAGLLIGALLLATGLAGRQRRGGRIAFTLLATLWAVAVGVFGAVIAMLWLFTDHYVTYANENVLQVNPLPLLLAALLLPALLGNGRALRLAQGVAAAGAALAVLGLLLQALPWFDQRNGEIIALVLPAHLAVAAVLWALGRRGAAPPAGPPRGGRPARRGVAARGG
jgi:hypothetical protein